MKESLEARNDNEYLYFLYALFFFFTPILQDST